LPFAIYYFDFPLNRLVIPTLLLLSVFCVLILFRDKSFNRQSLYKIGNKREYIKNIIIRWIFGVVVSIPIMYFFQNELFLALPRMNINLWLLVIILYPLLSVYPQEIIFRSYFFHRYSSLFGQNLLIIAMSGLVFGIAHLFFQNWIAPVLSALGGILFARTYSKTNSLLLAVLEHAIWGDLIFTIGLGYYFYSGNRL
jgi:membrane protease YdiL (CAAX protease family)